jgi:hypothetical protein
MLLLCHAKYFPTVFNNDQDCNGGLSNGWGGAGPSSCVKVGGSANSMLCQLAQLALASGQLHRTVVQARRSVELTRVVITSGLILANRTWRAPK